MPVCKFTVDIIALPSKEVYTKLGFGKVWGRIELFFGVRKGASHTHGAFLLLVEGTHLGLVKLAAYLWRELSSGTVYHSLRTVEGPG